MATVTRVELRRVARLHGDMAMPDARGLLDQCFDMISEALAAGENVGIREFGSFNVRHKAAQGGGRNPSRPDEAHTVPARRVVVFRASQVLKKAVDDGMRDSGRFHEDTRLATAGNQ